MTDPRTEIRFKPDVISASFGQRRVWFRDQLVGASPAYTVSIRIFLKGRVDISALEAALGDVVQRHESLRTTFSQRHGALWQMIHPAVRSAPLSVCRVPGVEDLTLAARYRFDLEHDFPFRAHLFTFDLHRNLLLLVTHCISIDAWSLRPLAQDLATAYAARCRGVRPLWPKLLLRYRDYTLWQQKLLGKQADPNSLISRQLLYWKKVLGGLPSETRLPGTQAKPRRISTNRNWALLRINSRLHKALLKTAQDNATSLADVLQAGLAVLLTKQGAGREILVGTVVSGRKHPGLKELVGQCANTIVLRIDTSENPSFRELLKRVRDATREALLNCELPFEYFDQARDALHSECPLFRVLLTLRKERTVIFTMPGVRWEVQPLRAATGDTDIIFDLIERRTWEGAPEGIEGKMEFDSDLFAPAAIARILEHLVHILEIVCADGPTVHEALGSTAGHPIDSFDSAPPSPRTGARAHWQQLYVPATDPLQDQLSYIWENLLGIQRVGIWDDFLDLGGDGISFARMLDAVEQACGVRPPIMDLCHGITIERLSEALVRQVPRCPFQVLHARKGKETAPFFFLHGDWNSGGYYCRELSRRMETSRPFYALQAHGLNGFAMPNSIEAMAADHLGTIRAIQSEGPYYLGGHCNGGLLAFEIARRLRQERQSVPALILIHSECHRHDPSLCTDDATRKTQSGEGPASAGILKAWLNNQYLHAVTRYAPQSYVGKTTVLWPRDEIPFDGVDPKLAWQKVAGEVELRLIPGAHLTCLTRHVGALAAEMSRCLQEADHVAI
ncbi:MAG TPA: condensation domain-containing protein [Candidatus Acidoferrales bacterium]|jgi:thioesterase domain-containing protein|nr:condensation domain-containing protein [Candidatus Acidoferrales bacterium]